MSVFEPEGVISFARGIPSPDLLDPERAADAARRALARDGRTILNYGPAAGYAPLREWLAERHDVPAGRVLVTPGSLVALNLVAAAVFGDGGVALVERPTYDRALRALAGAGAAVEAIPQTPRGIDLDALAERLGRPPLPKLLYLLPTFHNPTARTLPLDERRRLVALAREHGLLVYEDDPYGLCRFEGDALPYVHELAGGDGVILASSFSKSVAPGLRVGYVVLPEALFPAVEALALDLYVSPPIVPQATLLELVRDGGLEENAARVSSLLRERRDAMAHALAAELPEARFDPPEGGYFLWLELPGPATADELLPLARSAGVTYVPGSAFGAGPEDARRARLAFSFAAPAEIAEGVRRLAAAATKS